MHYTKDIKDILDTYQQKYNNPDFIYSDPISIPHQFTKKEDIEISGFLSATLAWGNRKAIIKSARQLISWMDNSPHDFIKNANDKELEPFYNFKYRTFNGTDCVHFLKSLQNIYKNQGGLESAFTKGYNSNRSIKDAIYSFRELFFTPVHEKRTEKHVANPYKNSAAKRLNMFLRWMVRHDKNGVDFGIWETIKPSHLMIPLDIHTGTIAREFGILKRKQDDWKAVEELMQILREFDSDDPVKYDYALFGLGVNRSPV